MSELQNSPHDIKTDTDNSKYIASSDKEYWHPYIEKKSYTQDSIRVDEYERKNTHKPKWYDTELSRESYREWSMVFHNGNLVEFKDPSGPYYAHFENGIPVGEYRMPFGYFKEPLFPEITGEQLIDNPVDNIPELKIICANEELSMEKDSKWSPYAIVSGIWTDGKFTGSTDGELYAGFYAKWKDGNLVRASLYFEKLENRGYVLPYKNTRVEWSNKNKCDVEISYNVNHSKRDIIEKYSLYKGLKEGIEKIIKGQRCIEESEYKAGKLHGTSKKYNKDAHWLERETQYKDGKKHGFEKLYNSDGSVAEMKYWQNGKDCTAEYNRLKKIASKHIAEEDKQSEGKDKRVVLKRKSKVKKAIDLATEAVKDKLHLR